MSSPRPANADVDAKVIDLTHPLAPGKVPAWPGHPCYSASLNSSLARGQPANVHSLTIGTHTGTHLDAPFHFFMDGTTVDRLDLTLLTAAPAVVADVRHRDAHERITWDDMAAAAAESQRRERGGDMSRRRGGGRDGTRELGRVQPRPGLRHPASALSHQP